MLNNLCAVYLFTIPDFRPRIGFSDQ